MKRLILCCLSFSFQLFCALSFSQTHVENNTNSIRGNGMCFMPNQGQIVDDNKAPRPDILFKGEGGGADVYIRKTGVSCILNNIDEVITEVESRVEQKRLMEENVSTQESDAFKQKLIQEAVVNLHRLDMDLVNCNTDAEVVVDKQVEGYSNYYNAQCREGITHLKSYNEITLKNIYNNVDIKYYGGKEQGLKYDIVVRPGGNIADVQLKYTGAEEIKLENGVLKIKTSLGEIREWMPRVYQNINGKIVNVIAHYNLHETILGFQISNYSTNHELIIDPWITYYGGAGWDQSADIATDNSGNVVVTGWTWSTTFISSPGAYQTFLNGSSDVFVAKFDATGTRLWATYYGGSDSDVSYGIDTDNNGNIIIVGYTTSTTSISSTGAYQVTLSGIFSDAFVVKFDPMGTRLWASYYGGTNVDQGFGVAVDNGGNVFITGSTQSTAAISSGGAYQVAFGGLQDAFIIKFNSAGTRLWATYYGGTNMDVGFGIAIDIGGNVVITGQTQSATSISSAGAHQLVYGGNVDAFVAKFDPIGVRLWATYYGGSGSDIGYGIIADNNSNVIVTGVTQSAASISSAGSYQLVRSGTQDAFVVKFNSAGTRIWATYLGGSSAEEGIEVKYDKNNNSIVVSGDTYSPNFPVTPCAYQTNFMGSEDQYITHFDANGNLICSGLIGLGASLLSPHNEEGHIVLSGCYVYLLATTNCNYPVTAGSYQTACRGSTEIALCQLYLNTCGGITSNLNFGSSTTTVCSGTPVNYTSNYVACDTAGIKYLWSFSGGIPATSTAINPTGVNYNVAGLYSTKLLIELPCGKDSIVKSAYITVNPSIMNSANVYVCGGQSVIIHGVSQNVSGVYTQTFVSAMGCDSISSVNLTVASPINTSGFLSICTGQTIVIHGVLQNTTGVYTQTFTAAGGCDSVSSVTLNVNSLSTSTINPASCNSYTQNGQSYSSSGIYTQTLSSSSGCDSLLTINLTISPTINTNNNVSICSGQTTVIHGVSQNTSGVYTQTFVNAVGCDSISSITLNVNNLSASTINPLSCTTYTLNSQTYSSSGIYTQTLSNASGCDSLLTINLTISSTINTNNNQTICSGASATIHGVNQNSVGIYTQTFSTTGGCDSISTINLSVTPTPTLTVTPLIDTINMGNNITITASGASVYSWGNGSTTSSITASPIQNTRYCIVGTNSIACADTICSDIIVMSTTCDGTKIFIPTGFSPNGDGQNDELRLFANGIVTTLHFAIYNGWGEIVFETNDITKTWNGYFNSQLLDADVFIYTLSYSCKNDNTENVVSGNISLVR